VEGYWGAMGTASPSVGVCGRLGRNRFALRQHYGLVGTCCQSIRIWFGTSKPKLTKEQLGRSWRAGRAGALHALHLRIAAGRARRASPRGEPDPAAQPDRGDDGIPVRT